MPGNSFNSQWLEGTRAVPVSLSRAVLCVLLHVGFVSVLP